MTESVAGRIAVHFLPQNAAPGANSFVAESDGQALAEVQVTPGTDALRVAVATGAAPVADGAHLDALVDAVKDLAGSGDPRTLVLATGADLRLRYYARRAGFTGPLRGDLVLLAGRPTATGDLLNAPPPGTPARLLSDLQALLPGVDVVAGRPAGIVRSLLRGAASGVGGVAHLSARGPGDPEPLRLSVPIADDLMAEGIALTIDTALSVRRRFRPLIDRIRVFFDYAIEGLRAGTFAGVAEPAVRDVHLNPAYCLASEREVLERQAKERPPAFPQGQPRQSRNVQPPFTRLDSVVAHEYWHQIEFGLESGRYRDSVEFRRAVGGYFGVETLEHAIKGRRPDAPPEWQAARARLAEEVSEYATTAPKEATAELFAQWWCTPADPPPSARFFDQVLHRFFSTADLRR